MTGIMIKRLLVSAALALCLIGSAFAWQETYRASSDEVQTLWSLARESGAALPSFTAPVTGSQILRLMDFIDRASLAASSQAVYDGLRSKLEHPSVLHAFDEFGFQAEVKALAGEMRTCIGDIPAIEKWSIEYKDRMPVFAGDLFFFAGEHLAANICLDGMADYGAEKLLGARTRLQLVTTDLNHTLPHKAYASIGNDCFNLIAGRDRVSAGGGVFGGNLSLSENFIYEDFAKFSFIKRPVSYDLTVIVFNTYTSDTTDSHFDLRYTDFNSPVKALIVHRLSAVLFDRLCTTIYEGAMIYGSGIFSDIRIYNPFMILHNTGSYLTGNTNNFFGVEMDFALGKGLSIGLQTILDQIQLSSEDYGENAAPDAYGALLNLKGTWSIGECRLEAYAEGVYASPGLYLKEKENNFPGSAEEKVEYAGDIGKYYELDLVGSYKHYFSEPLDNEIAYVGYRYGGDLAAFGVGAALCLPSHRFSLDCVFRAKGERGIDSGEKRYLEAGDSASPSGKVEYRLVSKLRAEGRLSEFLEYRCELASLNVWNHQHSDRRFNDLQLTIGVSVDLTDLIIRRRMSL